MRNVTGSGVGQIGVSHDVKAESVELIVLEG